MNAYIEGPPPVRPARPVIERVDIFEHEFLDLDPKYAPLPPEDSMDHPWSAPHVGTLHAQRVRAAEWLRFLLNPAMKSIKPYGAYWAKHQAEVHGRDPKESHYVAQDALVMECLAAGHRVDWDPYYRRRVLLYLPVTSNQMFKRTQTYGRLVHAYGFAPDPDVES